MTFEINTNTTPKADGCPRGRAESLNMTEIALPIVDSAANAQICPMLFHGGSNLGEARHGENQSTQDNKELRLHFRIS